MLNKSKIRRVRRGLDFEMPPEDSELHRRFQENSQGSPLLRLPPELRLRIYELVLSVGQINVDHASYRGGLHRRPRPATARDGTDIAAAKGKDRVSGFYCRTLREDENPWGAAANRSQPGSTPWGGVVGMTLLSGVCRQLYHETAMMPFRLNSWSFWDAHIMNRFIDERRLSLRQRRAVHTLYVRGKFPKATEKYFGGLKVVVWYELGKLRRQVLADEPLPRQGRAVTARS